MNYVCELNFSSQNHKSKEYDKTVVFKIFYICNHLIWLILQSMRELIKAIWSLAIFKTKSNKIYFDELES